MTGKLWYTTLTIALVCGWMLTGCESTLQNNPIYNPDGDTDTPDQTEQDGDTPAEQDLEDNDIIQDTDPDISETDGDIEPEQDTTTDGDVADMDESTDTEEDGDVAEEMEAMDLADTDEGTVETETIEEETDPDPDIMPEDEPDPDVMDNDEDIQVDTDPDVTDPDSIEPDVDIEPETDTDSTLVSCPLSGNGGREITIIPESEELAFGYIPIGGVRNATITICNSGSQVFDVLGFSLSATTSPYFSLSTDPLPINLPPGWGSLVNVLYRPGEEGWHTGTITVTSNATRPSVAIGLTGGRRLVGDLQVSPEELTWELSYAGNQSLQLRNIGGADLTVSEFIVANPAFSVIGVTPGGLPGPWTIAAGGHITATVAYNGQLSSSTTVQMTIQWNNGVLNQVAAVDLAARADICARPMAGEDKIVAPYGEVQIDGSASFDPNFTPAPGAAFYRWSVVSTPPNATPVIIRDAQGGAIAGIWSPESMPFVTVSVVGTYVIGLQVNPSDDSGCSAMDTVSITTAAVADDIVLELYWNVPNNDHDLHLVRPGGCYTKGDTTNVDDCHWTNCATRDGTATPCPPRGCPGPDDAPDWSTLNVRPDDPMLVHDDIAGTGPETIVLNQPEPGDYWTVVEKFSGSTATEMTLDVYIRGELIQTFTGTMPGINYHWNVCYLQVRSNGTIGILPIDTYMPTASSTTRICDPENNGPDGDIDEELEEEFADEEVDIETAPALCPEGYACEVYNDIGSMGCLLDGVVPPEAPACTFPTDHRCGTTGNDICIEDNVCLEACGECPEGQVCYNVTGDGVHACLSSDLTIPADAATDCEWGGCPGNASCFNSGDISVCLFNCSAPH